ncbi:MAG: glutamine--fructose-6-phosphate transaminase (isomerizing) [Euryarchaeota archaeon]|nr:glutamine--fructose-6-phosphate transaminase (isomerizing) [Euryarchaeota archaeon]
MCGIVGYTGYRQAQPILVGALKRLEYRGYDSAGIALGGEKISVYKDKGEVAHIEAGAPRFTGVWGIAHTRWATHGKPTKNNAHPFMDCNGKVALAHNGIIENYGRLKDDLMRRGHVFTSETDTETVVHLIEENYKGNLEEAARTVVKMLEGSYALVMMHVSEPGKVVAVRKESPLILGIGDGENFVASDVPALLDHTDRVISMQDGEVAVITQDGVTLTDVEGKPVDRGFQRITFTLDDAERGGYEHFMLKEIFEQPRALHDTLVGKLGEDAPYGIPIDGVRLIACGTSYHASLVGKYVIESIAKLPAQVEVASEYRYGAVSREHPFTVLISQSGETADTLAAAKEATRRGCYTVGITNILGSSITREVDETIYTRAGIEIGVAATKTYLTQLAALYLLAMRLGTGRTLRPDTARQMREGLRSLPQHVQRVLNNSEEIEKVAKETSKARDMFFIGRNLNYPVALEGALKMKEISYIHAEGYPAGELKHGPLALLSPEAPVIAIAVKDHTYEKMLSNIGEVSARGSPVVGICSEGDRETPKYVDYVLRVPDVPTIFSPVPVSVVLQLLAYYAARERGCPIDKPRNLAKSVTVE